MPVGTSSAVYAAMETLKLHFGNEMNPTWSEIDDIITQLIQEYRGPISSEFSRDDLINVILVSDDSMDYFA